MRLVSACCLLPAGRAAGCFALSMMSACSPQPLCFPRVQTSACPQDLVGGWDTVCRNFNHMAFVHNKHPECTIRKWVGCCWLPWVLCCLLPGCLW